MKRERILIILILIVLFVAAWMISITAATGVKKVEEQNSLVEDADILSEKGLYVRAIPQYESALAIKTENNDSIEAKLLNAYYQHGDDTEYVDMVKRRLKNDISNPDEVYKAVELMLKHSNIDKVMELLNEGIKKFDDERLISLYEDNAYRYTITDTKYSDIRFSEYKGIYSAYDGEVWTYIDSDYGWPIYENLKYEYASPFSAGGYAVVKEEGTYYTILPDGDHYGKASQAFEDIYGISGTHVLAKQNGKYSYYNLDFESATSTHKYDEITENACGVAAVKKDGYWGIITDSGEVVVDFNLEDVAINSLNRVFSSNVAMVKKDGRWHLINNKGEDLSNDTFADARAPESDQYIAVANEAGDWGFIDRQGNIVINYKYLDAKSFSDGLAAVNWGGRWQYISLRGNTAIDEDLTDANPFHYGKTIVKKAEQIGLLKLRYVNESNY